MEWVVRFQTAEANGYHHGLAGFVFDLAFTEFPPGAAPGLLVGLESGQVPTGLDNFSRPMGISNPAPPGQVGSTLTTGFGGTPMIRPDGMPALVQIGGAQNTFGVSGINIGQSHQLVYGIGDDGVGTIVAQGSFTLTSLPYGAYTLSIEQAAVNMIVGIATPPALTPTSELVLQQPLSQQFILACLADFNQNGVLQVQDLFDFLAAWFAGDGAADINRDNNFTAQDIFDYLALWFAGC